MLSLIPLASGRHDGCTTAYIKPRMRRLNGKMNALMTLISGTLPALTLYRWCYLQTMGSFLQLPRPHGGLGGNRKYHILKAGNAVPSLTAPNTKVGQV